MKNKDYKTPEIKVVKLKLSHTLLTISGDTYNQTTSGVETVTNTSFGSRRGGSLWDDDED